MHHLQYLKSILFLVHDYCVSANRTVYRWAEQIKKEDFFSSTCIEIIRPNYTLYLVKTLKILPSLQISASSNKLTVLARDGHRYTFRGQKSNISCKDIRQGLFLLQSKNNYNPLNKNHPFHSSTSLPVYSWLYNQKLSIILSNSWQSFTSLQKSKCNLIILIGFFLTPLMSVSECISLSLQI